MTEKYVQGRKEGVKDNQGKMTKRGTNKTIDGDSGGSHSGSHDEELSKAASSIYGNSVKNGGGRECWIGDKAVKNR